MTNINTAFSTAVGTLALGAVADRMATAANFAQMGFQLGVMLNGAFQPAAPAFSASMPQDGKATVDLGDGYTLEINEANSEFVVRDADGNVTQIWGDPHFNYNGQHIGDFWDTMSLELENGTKITVNTEPFGNNPNATVTSQLVITRGDQAMIIDGVSQNQLGDLNISMSNNGYAIDAAYRDGLTIREDDAAGSGWTSGITGDAVSQEDFNLTKIGNAGLPEALQAFSDALRGVLGAWLLTGVLSGLAEALGGASETSEPGSPRVALGPTPTR
ncbi:MULTISPECIES: DUF1521 domain-containing protein [Brevundimonas]|uniref:DUF1521 domain-containing protein n=1 Tax=Brevundimonas TaxID=41275 RepID=UPI00257A7844|nr:MULTISPECIES: DUF1521 domain-containing protein [Brevundimonas]